MESAKTDPAAKPVTSSAPALTAARIAHSQAARKRAAKRRAQITELRPNLIQRVIFYLLVGMMHVLSLIPDFILYPLGVAGGFVAYLVDRRHGRIGMRNLAVAFPAKSAAERRRILRASYLNI